MVFVVPAAVTFLQTNNYEFDITVVWIFFRGKSRSKSRHLGTEPVVRFSFDNTGDNVSKLYKGLENPSYAVRERPHNEYQELMAQELNQEEEVVEDIATVNENHVQYDVVNRNLHHAKEFNVYPNE